MQVNCFFRGATSLLAGEVVSSVRHAEMSQVARRQRAVADQQTGTCHAWHFVAGEQGGNAPCADIGDQRYSDAAPHRGLEADGLQAAALEAHDRRVVVPVVNCSAVLKSSVVDDIGSHSSYFSAKR